MSGIFISNDRIKAGTASVRGILILDKVVDKAPIERFVNLSEQMILRNHFIHAHHNELFPFLIEVLTHHKFLPPF